MIDSPAFNFLCTDPASQASLYEAPRAAMGAWSGYLLPANGQTPPDCISFGDSLSPDNKASYLFAQTRPLALDTDPGSFINAVSQYLAMNTGSSSTILWLKSVDPLEFGPFNNYGISILYNSVDQSFTTNSNLNVRLGQNLLFNILLGTGIYIDQDNGMLRLSAPVATPPAIAFQRGSGNLGIRVTGTNGFIRNFIPFIGSNTGCCTFTASIDARAAFGASGLPVSLVYTADGKGGQRQFRYPILTAPAQLPNSITWMGTVDPLDPYNQKLTAAAQLAGVLRTGFLPTSTPALPSAFVNDYGNQINLIALGASDGQPPFAGLQSGALALSTDAAAPADPLLANALLTLAGRFGMNVAGLAAGAPAKLLCGIFGSERISFSNYDANTEATDNDYLLYRTGSAAYAPSFPFVDATLDQPNSGAVSTVLNATRQTSWATILQGSKSAVVYHAEPGGSPLYGHQRMSQSASPLLPSAPPEMPLPHGAALAFPLVPYAAMSSTTADGQTLAAFESSILAATRKRIISQGASSLWQARSLVRKLAKQGLLTADGNTAYRTTPQGAIATVSTVPADHGAFLSVTLGQTGGSLPFGFELPDIALQDALQTNQLFLVAVNPANLSTAPSVFRNKINIAGWSMSAEVGQGVTPTVYRNVMLLKYCSGSFKDRIKNPNAWSSAAEFSLPANTDTGMQGVAYTGLSQWLQDYVSAAELMVANNKNSPYRHFVELVNDPAWNGVLVLRADLEPSSLPAGLQGIVAGLDLQRFTAHHFGFTASRVNLQTDGSLTFNGDSSSFGLIDYLDPQFAVNQLAGLPADTPIALPQTGNYAFRVLQLQVLFDNAAIKTFKSYVQLGVNRLLNSNVTLTSFAGQKAPFNGVVLNGSYIDQNGTGVYIFEQSSPTIFALDSNVLNAVAINRIQFNCLGNVDGGATVLNRFIALGTLNFAALKDINKTTLDVLSFGATEITAQPQGQGLSFSNLVIDMRYPQTTPNAVVFTEVTTNLAYDLQGSSIREASLFQGFGLQLNSFIAASDGQLPADFGFLPVTTALNLTTLEGPWYGVVYNVTMGGPGALASAAGFSSRLLLAWSPVSKAGEDSHALFVGLSLPGAAPGAKLISLQGIFKVAIDNISLMRQKVPGSSNDAFYYCLRLDNIAIKIFGIAKLPPDANIQFFLFGDPDNTGSLGWYAAYVADKSKNNQVLTEQSQLLPISEIPDYAKLTNLHAIEQSSPQKATIN
ncbi:hypothetical protein [Undibacterium pigrum]|uniref:Uncharacterized protein n=1 Tax=Undibacterium pigrum TaxID=401470 RepID=A0A318JBS8_9BURK|nr:hypothetical protein [Undibacterium pigrum]PXX47038.1 hypothetical protein DFR42_101614 [Undibacterium pigrum]